MQKASNAFKVGKSRSKKNKELAAPAAAAAASASGNDAADVIETETSARALPVEEQQQHPAPETTPLDVHQEEVVVERNAAQSAREEATSQEVVSTDIETEEQRGRDEQASEGDAEKPKAIHDQKVVMEESEAVEVDKAPVPGEKPQTGNVEETAKEAETNTEDEPPAAVGDAAGKESSTLPSGQDEPAASMAREEVVEETKAEERQQQEEPAKQEEVKGNSEASAISEEPKEQAGESKLTAASRATSMPATSLEEALEAMDTPTNAATTTSRSEPVTPAKEDISKDKAVIDTLLSASAPTTPLRGGGSARRGGTSAAASMAKIPEEAVRLTFKGSKVKTALEKRPEEAQPKKKEVARSNDVLEETKSKLLEKKASKGRALVGAFEVVMDSPRASTPGKSPRPGDWQ